MNLTDIQEQIAQGTANALREFEKQFNKLEHEVTQMREKAKRDSKDIHDMYAIAHYKVTVLTEVAFLMRREKVAPEAEREVLAQLITAMDESDDYWHERRHISLGEWVKQMRERANKKTRTSFCASKTQKGKAA